MPLCECVFACTYWEALCDGDLNIEEKDSGSESSTDSNRLLGITEHTAHAERKQVISKGSRTYTILRCNRHRQ